MLYQWCVCTLCLLAKFHSSASSVDCSPGNSKCLQHGHGHGHDLDMMTHKVDDPPTSTYIKVDSPDENDGAREEPSEDLLHWGRKRDDVNTEQESTYSRKSLTLLARKLRRDHRSVSLDQESSSTFRKHTNFTTNFDAQRLGYLRRSREEICTSKTDRLRYSGLRKLDDTCHSVPAYVKDGLNGRIHIEHATLVGIDLPEVVTTSSCVDDFFVGSTSTSYETRHSAPLQNRPGFGQHLFKARLQTHRRSSDSSQISYTQASVTDHYSPKNNIKSKDNDSISSSGTWEMIDSHSDIDEYSHQQYQSNCDRDSPPSAAMADTSNVGEDYLLQLSSLMLGATHAVETKLDHTPPLHENNSLLNSTTCHHFQTLTLADDNSTTQATGNHKTVYHTLKRCGFLLLTVSFIISSAKSRENFRKCIHSPESCLIRFCESICQARNLITGYILENYEQYTTPILDCIVNSTYTSKLTYIRNELRLVMKSSISPNIKHAYRKLVESKDRIREGTLLDFSSIPDIHIQPHSTLFIQNNDFHSMEEFSVSNTSSTTETVHPTTLVPPLSPFYFDVILPFESYGGLCDMNMNQHMCSIHEQDEYLHPYASLILLHFWKRNGPFLQHIQSSTKSEYDSIQDDSSSFQISHENNNVPASSLDNVVLETLDRVKIVPMDKGEYHVDELFDAPLMDSATEFFKSWRKKSDRNGDRSGG